MADKAEIIEKIIPEIDWYIIERVRELRRDIFSQTALSIEIGFAEGFIGRIENPKSSATYTFRHINLIAKALKTKIDNILPKHPLSNDLIRITIRIGSPTKIKTGETNYEVISKVPLTEKEILEYNKNVLSRPSKSGKSPKLKKRKPKS